MVYKTIPMLVVCMIFSANTVIHAMGAGSRVTLPGGKKIFVCGMNLAWKVYAGDVGDSPLEETYFNNAFKAVADSGGNCMRVWLSTDGTKDPKYGSDGLVTGPGSQTIANIQKMLAIAKKNKMLLMPVLLTHNWVKNDLNSTILKNNKNMLKTEEGLQAYIDKYLIPVVKAIGNDPSLICWEVFNEPEGMVDGWSSPKNTITQAEVQRAVNWIAAAIHTEVPNVLVSNGAATIGTLNWYTNAALKTAGGKENGNLDFYMAHYYGWNGTSNSPFTKNYAAWSLDKPLVIGEYASTSWSTSTQSSSSMQDAGNVDTLMTYLQKAGYAGGMGWQYQPDAGDPWMKGFSTFGHSIAQAYRADSNSIKLDGVSSNTFAVMVSAGAGGAVKTSLMGQIAPGKTDTLTATASTGYTFTGWSGDTTSTDPVLVLKNIGKDWVLQANFSPNAGTNLLKGGDFSDNTVWSFYAAEGNTAAVKYTNDQANVTITKADSLNYHIQLTQGGIKLDSGVAYIISLDGWSSGERTLYVGLSTEGTWHFQDGGEVNLTGTKKTLQLELYPDSSTTAGIFQFNVGGGSLLPVYIDNVTMVKKTVTAVKRASQRVNSAVSFVRTGNMINWNSQSEKAEAFLISLSGRIMQCAKMNNGINLSSVPEGIYLFAIKADGFYQTFKIVR
jgi:uncharacterized repeat protein (TIGR02543 family)